MASIGIVWSDSVGITSLLIVAKICNSLTRCHLIIVLLLLLMFELHFQVVLVCLLSGDYHRIR